MEQPFLTVIAAFYNMRREAARTLYSLTTPYQRGIADADYEVLAIDNGSTVPLDEKMVASLGDNFSYRYHQTDCPSPSRAINEAARGARGEYVVLLIDGARILSPGILGLMRSCIRMHERCFVYTLGMHLGPEVQNLSLTNGYSQAVEDELLDGLNWQTDGYRLFGAASIALSSKGGFFSPIRESNCFALKKADFIDLGGFCEAFRSPGGGLVNLDFFNRANGEAELQPVMLLGEATFHQFHGGVATNVPMEEHPGPAFAEEYKQIRRSDYNLVERAPLYVGAFREVCKDLFEVNHKAG